MPDEDDDLLWFELKAPPEEEEEDSPFREALWAGSIVTSIVVGFSPDTGWPMVFVLKDDGIAGTLRVTTIDLKPNLEGVFEVPPEMRARLEAAEAAMDAKD